ncbi:MAG: DUF2281 domain-containing protein [Deltaproteobacteria bacterium]|nr:DUF2281 domain-containing protein [Deltaproteobacteria bacterium]
MEGLEKLIQELPPELRQEVEDFIHFLLSKRVRQEGRRLRQDWGGALREYRGQYSALDLEKKALEWRGD